ncbi:MAG: hypothetical protein CME70_15170 [Halobacteriovorax sp.]|nr:hypothetical protein [Halobacteriovorax sp.]|tara:strand:+ start:94452 stop:95225 length:774 start_codon:yes stop_codon:yes gene_type:complete
MKTILLLALYLASFSLFANTLYIPFVKPVEQRVIKDPRGGSSKRFEGCGPVAASMLFSYWEGERDYKILSEEQVYDGTFHPKKTIKEFYTASWSQKAPARGKAPDGKKYPQTFTLPNGLVKGLKTFVQKANSINAEKLIVKRLKAKNSNSKKLKTIERLLEKKVPFISLIHNIPACLNSKDNKSGGWHYVVIVGLDKEKKTIDLLSGWKELNADTSTDTEVHQRRSHPDSDKAHIKCNIDEFINANPAYYWIEELDS